MDMDIFDDEFAGMGGTYEVVRGKRRLVPGSRTLPPEPQSGVVDEPAAEPSPDAMAPDPLPPAPED
jgi:hypothetical protein